MKGFYNEFSKCNSKNFGGVTLLDNLLLFRYIIIMKYRGTNCIFIPF